MSSPARTSWISPLLSSVTLLLFCAGFLRVELKMKQHDARLDALESQSAQQHSIVLAVTSDTVPRANISPAQRKESKIETRSETTRARRHASPLNNTYTSIKQQLQQIINRLFKECGANGAVCVQGPPGPPGRPGHQGLRGRRGQKGRSGKSGPRGIMGPPGPSGKQGIMGPGGEKGAEGQKGDAGPPGMPGPKGDPGESLSSPNVIVNPPSLTVNESDAASMQCSAGGNPKPVIVWSKVSGSLPAGRSAVFGGKLEVQKSQMNDSGVYQCKATNILGVVRKQVKLVVNGHPRSSLPSGPIYVKEGDNVTLPACHVIGYPAPNVTWRRALSDLPQKRVKITQNKLKILSAVKDDSDSYMCEASNLLGFSRAGIQLVVVTLPEFIQKPSDTVDKKLHENVTLTCSAKGNPQPVISWKKEGGQLPAGRTQIHGGFLTISDLQLRDAGTYTCVAMSANVFHSEATVQIQLVFDCLEIRKSGFTTSGVYSVNPDGKGTFSVYCDMTTDGGGWTVFQRRQDGSQDFYLGWSQYKAGFGQLTGEFWLGNDKIHRLTASRPSELRVEVGDWSGGRAYAKYGSFRVGDEQSLYRVSVGSYSGTAGDSLTYHNNMEFSTKDRDNDPYESENCAVIRSGAWWYNQCQFSNLNGQYLGNKEPSDWKGVMWYYYKSSSLSMKFAEMKLRPTN